MSYRFFIGGSGSGKSRALQEEIIGRALTDPARQYIIVVPDQFTMQTQKEIVERHPNKGILNIDVQSFGRLCHRIGDEVGGEERIVLDDTGKNLILRHLSGELKGELPTIGSSLKKTGYIHEVKSVISEFMQYGLNPAEVEKLIGYSKARPLLQGKLKDVNLLYDAFEKYLGEKYITKEEKLDILARDIARSKQLKGAVVAFDGFTGFTPVQDHVITQLFNVCSELIFTIILPPEELEAASSGTEENGLFALSIKTMRSIGQLAKDTGVSHGEDRIFPGRPVRRYEACPALAHLEQSIFRRGAGKYPACDAARKAMAGLGTGAEKERAQKEALQRELRIFAAADPRSELKEIFARIHRLCCEEGLAYRDIAVISGDLERYAPDAEQLAAEYQIPIFIDQNRKLALNPFTEFLRGIFHTVNDGFRIESVLQLYKSGLSGLNEDEICRMENYLYAAGVRGRKNWEREFTRRPKYLTADDEAMAEVNGCRERTIRLLSPILKCSDGADAGTISRALYEIIEQNAIYDQLENYVKFFSGNGDEVRQKEYEQIYRIIIQLLEQIASLLSEERLTLEEYLEILEAGISEIKVGVLPQDVDRVVLGDMERTRLKPVKVLFFAGCNDGVIPRGSGGGGLISDTDREFLAGSGIPLAPTPREQMYIQRLYLYYALSRPSEQLILSYSAMDRSGASIRPSYLIGRVRELFEGMEIEDITRRSARERILRTGSIGEELPRLLTDYAKGTLSDSDHPVLYTLFDEELKRSPGKANALAENAFYRYSPKRLQSGTVHGLYGKVLTSSVSRLEKYAACAYQHFLKYGIRLQPREGSRLSVPDVGNLYHALLEAFGKYLTEHGLNWRALEDAQTEEIIKTVSEQTLGKEDLQRIYQDAGSAYQYERMQRILKRSIEVMRHQIRKGNFDPIGYEQKFEDIVALPDASLKFAGKIDRIDAMESEGRLYLKVVDYKSGDKSFSYPELWTGEQLQLPVYLLEAKKKVQHDHPGTEVLPAALYYYNLKDPILEDAAELFTELRPRGITLDIPEVLDGIDPARNGKSDAAEINWKRDGMPDQKSKVMTAEEMTALLSFTEKKLKQLSADIFHGECSVQPAEKENCEYCDYRGCCPFDPKIPGFRTGEKKPCATDAKELILRGAGEGEV